MNNAAAAAAAAPKNIYELKKVRVRMYVCMYVCGLRVTLKSKNPLRLILPVYIYFFSFGVLAF